MLFIELTSFSSLNEMIFSTIIDFDEERRGIIYLAFFGTQITLIDFKNN